MDIKKFNYFMKEYNPTFQIFQILGVIFAMAFSIISFCNSQESKRISKDNFNQSFRPIGTIIHSGDFIVLDYYNCISKKPFRFCYSPFLFNTGNGILSFLGHIDYSSKSKINFRKDFLNGKLRAYP